MPIGLVANSATKVCACWINADNTFFSATKKNCVLSIDDVVAVLDLDGKSDFFHLTTGNTRFFQNWNPLTFPLPPHWRSNKAENWADDCAN